MVSGELSKLLDLSGRLALVTGGSRGIGAAISRTLAMAGATVAVNYRSSKEMAEQLVEEIRSLGGNAFAVRGDVSSEEDVALIKEALSEKGKVSILVNNAGITRDKMLARMQPSDWDEVINVNLRSAYLVTRAFLPDMMSSRWGRIVNISSVVGLMGSPGQANYCASKAGLIGFTKALAREYARFGITVNAIAPGYIETDMTANIPEKHRKAYLDMIPLNRPGKPEDVARAVLFLVSELGSYVTGTVVNVSGGLYM